MPVAIKKYENEVPLSLNAFISEIECYSKTPCPFIVQILGAYQEGPFSYLVTELSPYGALSECIGDLSEPMRIRACIQVAQALDFLHTKELVHHRDIKSENVLVFSKSIHVKICDFGIAKRIQDDQMPVIGASSPPSCVNSTQSIGTVPWMAPEFIEQKVFSTKSDIYSFGIFMYEVFVSK